MKQTNIRILTVEDVAELMHLSVKSTRILFKCPKFPSQRFSKPWFVEESALIDWLANPHSRKDTPYFRNVFNS